MTRHVLPFVGALVTAALLACAPLGPLAAQEPADTVQLGELVVTATRFATSSTTVPAAVTVLDGEELRSRGLRTVAQALSGVPGAALARNGSTGGLTSLFMRGGESDYVQVMVDGVVLNEPGGAVDLGQLTLDNVARIEVVRGPVSVLYGSDAVSGVVHVITEEGSGDARLEVGLDAGVAPKRNGDAAACPGYPATPCPDDADLGMYGTHAFEAALTGGLGGLSVALGASGTGSGGAYAYNNEYRNRSVTGRVSGEWGRIGLATTARWTDALYHYPTDGAGRLVDANTYRSSESLALGLEAAAAVSSRVDLVAGVTLHDLDVAAIDDPDSAADTLGSFTSSNLTTVDRVKADAHANVSLPRATTATLGFEAERQHGTSDFFSDGDFGPFESSTDNARSNRAVYAQVVTGAVGGLTLTGGVRTEDNDRFGRFATWRAGANLALGDATVVRASAGSAFKEPTFFENYAEGFTVGNPALEPERSRSWEVGARSGFMDGLVTVGLTWFDQRFRNLIQYTGSPQPGESNYVNIGVAASRGLEVEVQAGRAGGASLTASWVYLDTEVLDEGFGTDRLFQAGERLVRRPAHRIHLTGSVPATSRGRAGATLTRVGERDDLDFLDDFSGERIVLPAYTVVDVFAEARLLEAAGALQGLALILRVDNVLGTEYAEIVHFPSLGRTVSLGLRAIAGF